MSHRSVMILIVVFIVALLPRAARLWQGRAAPLDGDAIEYESLGRSLADGHGYHSRGGHPMVVASGPQPTAFRTPTLPLFIAAHYKLLAGVPGLPAEQLVLAPRLTLVLLNALAAALLYAALRRRSMRTRRAPLDQGDDQGDAPAVPLLAALLFALWPESLVSFYQNDLLLAESLALPLLVLVLLCYGRGGAALIVAGLALGAVILLRAYLILLPPLLCLVALGLRRRDLLRRALIVGALAALLVAPWSYRNLRVFGRLVPLSTQQGVSLWYGWNEGARGSWSALWYKEAPFLRLLARHPQLPALPEPQRSAVFAAAAREAVARRGALGNLKLLLRKWALYASPKDVYGWHPSLLLGLPLALLGGLRRLRRLGLAPGQRARPAALCPEDQLLLALAANSLLVVGLIFMDQRFRYIALPATLTFAAEGLVFLWCWLRRRLWREVRRGA